MKKKIIILISIIILLGLFILLHLFNNNNETNSKLNKVKVAEPTLT